MPKTKKSITVKNEQSAVNQIMGSSVERAFNMAVDNGATIANPGSTATKIANVDSLPKVMLWGDKTPLATEAYAKYRTKPTYVQARRLTQNEEISNELGTCRGKVGDYRIILSDGTHWLCSAQEFNNQYEKL